MDSLINIIKEPCFYDDSWFYILLFFIIIDFNILIYGPFSFFIGRYPENAIEQFQQKWEPVLRPELRQNNKLEHFCDSRKNRNALVSDIRHRQTSRTIDLHANQALRNKLAEQSIKDRMAYKARQKKKQAEVVQ